MKVFTTDLIKANSAAELEQKALSQARRFFGDDAELRIQDYTVAHYGGSEPSPGSYLTIELIEDSNKTCGCEMCTCGIC